MSNFRGLGIVGGMLLFLGAASLQADVVNTNPSRGAGDGGIIFGATSGGTATRVLFSNGSGQLADDSDMIFVTDTFTVTKFGSTILPTDQTFTLGAATLGTLGATSVHTPDTAIFLTGTLSNGLHIKEFGDLAHDGNNCSAGTSAGTDPFLCVHSHNQSTTEWIDIKHNGTNGIIAVGVGALLAPGGTAGTAAGLAFIDAPTLGFATRNSNKLDVISGANTIVTMGSGLAGANGLIVVGAHMLQFNNTAGGTPDLSLSRQGGAILQLGVDVNGSAVAQTIKAHDGITGTDIAGANLTLSGGTGTGTGVGGNVITQTSPSLATGTTQQTAAARMVQVAKPKALTAASATSVVLFAVAASTVGGGHLEYTVRADDGTDFQVRSGRVGWAVVNKAGTETCAVYGTDSVLGVAGSANPNQTQDNSGAGAMSAGTLTYTWGVDTSGANSCALTLSAASSLTETTLEISYTVFRQHGTGAITPQ